MGVSMCRANVRITMMVSMIPGVAKQIGMMANPSSNLMNCGFKRALKSILFPNKGYDDILYDLGMCTLHERRNVICEQYFKNMQGNSHKLHHLLPEERCIHYDMRRENKYPLTKNRTNRYGKSLIP